jgi:2-polyprenyl-3-methyl-5-hydroxy-6-metoxy-1,4-benzoquinol methylase
MILEIDLSLEEVERAKQEASLRDLSIAFSVADMRQTFDRHARPFDIVMSCDNSIPHLLSNEDVITAFRQFYQTTRRGGDALSLFGTTRRRIYLSNR